MPIPLRFARHFLLSSTLLVACHLAHADALATAKAQLASGKVEQAYQTLAAEEFTLAGQPDYDYLLGLAALQVGKPATATLAFERVLAMQPQHAGARLDMGRAYFQLGDYERARSELEALQVLNPPPAAQQTLERYLKEIDSRQQARRTRLSAYAEVGLGSDSNPAYAPAQRTIVVGPFVSATLDQASSRQRETFSAGAVGGEVQHSLGGPWSLYGGLDTRQRLYAERDQYSIGSLDLRGGMQHTEEGKQLRFGAGANYTHQAVVGERSMWSANADWRVTLDQRNELSVFAQHNLVRYTSPAIQVQDMDQTLLGTGWQQLFGSELKHAFFGSLFATHENAISTRPDGNKLALGLRAGISYATTEKTDCFAILSAQQGRYEIATNNLRSVVANRQDSQFDLSLGLSHRLDGQWTVRPTLSYSKNNSNVPIYNWDRLEGALTLRRDFR